MNGAGCVEEMNERKGRNQEKEDTVCLYIDFFFMFICVPICIEV